jgi:hypothetical protein
MTMTAEDVVEVSDALEHACVEVWIDGGWGVDALLEEQTRALHERFGVDLLPEQWQAITEASRRVHISARLQSS